MTPPAFMRGPGMVAVIGTAALLAAGAVLPSWLRFYLQTALASGLAALGVMTLMRAGLVSFGHGLFFCLGGYAAGMSGHFWGISDALSLLALGLAASGAAAAALGFLMARYREIFFAMLSLALSMILYGLLARAEFLGSTDGFNLPRTSYFGWVPQDGARDAASYVFSVVLAGAAAFCLHRYLASPMGLAGDSIRGNEIRVEYLGVSPRGVIHRKYILSAMLAGAGGTMLAVSVGHVDPEMAYWTTSGQFVFIALLSGAGNVAAPLVGAFLLEVVRIYAVEASPNTWQMILGATMLAVILFLPKGLWSLAEAVFSGRRT